MSKPLVSDDYQHILLSSAPLLDVRAPIEFSKGAFPGAKNIPLLDDNARHMVGIEYKENGQQPAIDLGAKLLPEPARKILIERWMQFAGQHPDGYLYCFRGGLRSRISQAWLRDAGCDYPLVKGGYKALRQYLIHQLQGHCNTLSFCLIGGRTGVGKTRLLNTLPRSVDLEGLARHRGSSFGRLVVDQPSNIDFEHAVTLAFIRLAAGSEFPVFLEDEARMIGSACIPAALREQTLRAPVALLEASLDTRVRIGIEDYVVDLLRRYQQHLGEGQGFVAFADYHRSSLQRVQKRLGGARYSQALELLNSALASHASTGEIIEYEPFIRMILTEYYDPMYDYQIKGKKSRVVFSGDAQSLKAWCVSQRSTDLSCTL